MNLTRALCALVAVVLGASNATAAGDTTAKTADQTATPMPPEIKAMQAEFLKLKFGMFLHFNLETYRGVQWLAGYHDPSLFNPGTDTIDTDAWADAAAAAGMKYGVLTAKHVSGFCLWDSKLTTYSVMNPKCPYKKDLVAQFIKSFKSRGLKVGVYYCWRNPGFGSPKKFKVLPPECDPATHSVEEQIAFQKAQITELLTRYPDLFYVWNDGLDPEIMPASEAMKFIHGIRPDVVASANWWDWKKKGQSYIDLAVTEGGDFPKGNTLPGETCATLEQSWFWNEKSKPKEAPWCVSKLRIANSRNANLLLNVAPNKQGRLGEESVKTLAEIGRLLNASAATGNAK